MSNQSISLAATIEKQPREVKRKSMFTDTTFGLLSVLWEMEQRFKLQNSI